MSGIRSLLGRIQVKEEVYRVLDVGCGDGFISRELFKNADGIDVAAVDTNLTDEEVSNFNTLSKNMVYFNDYSLIREENYHLMLLLDVIEHVEHDHFLRDMASRYVVGNGHIVITAPAFQALFGSHDRFLKHHRRYDRRQLVDLAGRAELECLASGYFFLSLLPIRFLASTCEKIMRSAGKAVKGVGGWNHGRWITRCVEIALKGDVRVSLALNRLGVVLPGLTVWAVCRRPR